MRRIAIATGAIAVAIALALGCSSNGRADPGAQKPPIWREGSAAVITIDRQHRRNACATMNFAGNKTRSE